MFFLQQKILSSGTLGPYRDPVILLAILCDAGSCQRRELPDFSWKKRNETGKTKQDTYLKCRQVRLRDARCRGSRRMLNCKNHRNVDKQDCGRIGILVRSLWKADTGCSISALPGLRTYAERAQNGAERAHQLVLA